LRMDGWMDDHWISNLRMDGWMVIGWVTWRWMDGWVDGHWMRNLKMDGWSLGEWFLFLFEPSENITKLWSSHCAHWMICCVVYWLHRCLLVRLMYISFIHSFDIGPTPSFFYNGKKATHLQPTRGRRRIPLDAGGSKHQTKPKWPTPIGTTNIALCFALIKLTWLVLRF
jgi:hypothetical protein